MNRTLLIFIIICISIYSNLSAIEKYDSRLNDNEFYTLDTCIEVNQTDSLGNKEGVWISRYGHILFFNHGDLSSSCVLIDQRNDDQPYIKFISNYADSKPLGSFVSFHPNGVISELIINISPNTDFLTHPKDSTDVTYALLYQSYNYEFNEQGILIAEGWMVFGEDIEIDFEKVGKWKYYELNGQIKIIDYGNHLPEPKYNWNE